MSPLISSKNVDEFSKWLSVYPKAIKYFSEKRKKEKLLDLDYWYQNELSQSICSRNPCSITKDELVKLMEWKLTRGKFRPRLTELIKSNTPELIGKCSIAAFQNSDSPAKALNELCKLKAVGPATASAILAVAYPQKFAFMADESVQAVLPGKIDYTMKFYLRYLEAIKRKSKEINTSEKTLSLHDIELALWSCEICKKHGFDDELLAETSVVSKKRKSEENDNAETKKKR